MSAIKQIRAQVFQTESYQAWKEGCNPIPYTGVSTNYVSQGEEWFVPQRAGGVFELYNREFANSAPTGDSVRTVRLKNEETNATIWILGTEVEWLEKANGCCGETPIMDEVTYPNPVAIEEPCADTVVSETDPTYSYRTISPVSSLISGQKLQLQGNCGGTTFTPAPPGAGFTTVALALAWAQANWSAYGTFTAIEDDEDVTIGIKLVSETCESGFINLVLLEQNWCLDIGGVIGSTFDAIKHNGVNVDLGLTGTVGADAQTVVDIIKDYFSDGILERVSPHHANYYGTGVPGGIGNLDEDDVYTSVKAFTAGECTEES